MSSLLLTVKFSSEHGSLSLDGFFVASLNGFVLVG
jgi:hypothetical protein